MSLQELGEYTRIAKYARFNKEKNRRETWNEQIERVMKMHKEHIGSEKVKALSNEIEMVESHLRQKKIVGSQRALQFGGPAVVKKNARLYNCTTSYCDRPRFFQEAMWLLLAGCGVGFSVQTQHIAQLPDVEKPDPNRIGKFTIPDSIEGWADSVGVLLSSYFVENQPFPDAFGKTIEFDYSLIRPSGSIISDTNGKAPGAEPLKRSIELIRNLIDNRITSGENRLHPIDLYDIVMHASDAVLSGGVRRSATICMFSPEDQEMMTAKTGNWYETNPQRGRSNNSVMLLRDKTSEEDFKSHFENIKQFGEPGFVFVDDLDTTYNPCCEIGLWPKDEFDRSGWAFCNLSEINAKKCKSEEEFYDVCASASIIGTIQASYTNFDYLGEITENIVKREALLGVSITGVQDNPVIALNPEILKRGASIVVETNKRVADILGINHAARTTTIKPSGSTSALLGTGSGIHPQHAKRYIRRVQANKNEETLKFFEFYNGSAVQESVWSNNKSDKVISFVCEVPKDARTKNDVGALQLLADVKLMKEFWIDSGKTEELCANKSLSHNVSNTINIKDEEWDAVREYIYNNRSSFAGISLLSVSGDKDYAQAPFQTVYTPKEMFDMYGDATVFASGLIVHAQRAFGDLYKACASLLGQGEVITDRITFNSDISIEEAKNSLAQVVEKKAWLERARKFSVRYFDGNNKKMTYCLKDVDAWKSWVDLTREYMPVPWELFFESMDNTKVAETVACSGGNCEVKRM